MRMFLTVFLFSVSILSIVSCDDETLTVACYEWAYSVGGPQDDRFYAIAQLADGSYVIAGESWSFGNKKAKSELILLNLKVSGKTNWVKLTGGPAFEKGMSVTPLKDGGFILGGDTTSYGFGHHNLWLTRFDSNSLPVWQNIYKGQLGDTISGVIPLADGGMAVCATSDSFGAGLQDYWLFRLDANGMTNWQKTFGGRDSDIAGGAAAGRDGSFVIAGNARSFGSGIWVIKINPDGTLRWEKYYSGKVTDNANCIAATKDDGFIIAGYTWSFGTGRSDMLVIKIDKRGELVWEKCFGGPKNDVAYVVIATADNGCIVAGITESFGLGKTDVWILRLSSAGDLVWQKTFGGAGYDYVHGGCASFDKGFALVGSSDSFGAGKFDAWVLKLNMNGEISNETSMSPSNTSPVKVVMHLSSAYDNVSELLKGPKIDIIIKGDSFAMIEATSNIYTNIAIPFIPIKLSLTQ
ncbi:MAG: hypothetical protein A2Y33_01110 [Spirochaetes bacterium GWF1_51_8]|nr:MAG: hypothetical protein A2Y33_01110 [Spirochaetes bacterium GWF1_51_8]